MYHIHFKSVINGEVIADMTYGNYKTSKEAAEQISKEATTVAKSDSSYFGHFNEQRDEDRDNYNFSWLCDWEDVDSIEYNRCYWIYNRCYWIGECGKDNGLEWEIEREFGNRDDDEVDSDLPDEERNHIFEKMYDYLYERVFFDTPLLSLLVDRGKVVSIIDETIKVYGDDINDFMAVLIDRISKNYLDYHE